ncbi:hypothetical protein Vse01_20230 [Micromonospora sediminimaris]|uniref:Uncharacterized protein n=1 Tax=Micromonospora sediminimaris TaxID=547162 RepID=A0A9W5UQN1_9ACTN|nr:hypothetical protein Vse01_20230 [Micromonospora sediminimaris]
MHPRRTWYDRACIFSAHDVYMRDLRSGGVDGVAVCAFKSLVDRGLWITVVPGRVRIPKPPACYRARKKGDDEAVSSVLPYEVPDVSGAYSGRMGGISDDPKIRTVDRG